MEHDKLVDIALKWIQRAPSRFGGGCQFASTEMPTGVSGERPDVFGLNFNEFKGQGCSTLIEVKASRADFLADKNKLHRTKGGVGQLRYYLAPKGLIDPSELPAKWGLLGVTARGHVHLQAGLAYDRKNGVFNSKENWLHEANLTRERYMIGRMLARVGNAHEVNEQIRFLNRQRAYLLKSNEQLRKSYNRKEKKLDKLYFALKSKGIEL